MIVVVHGHLWVFDALLDHQCISPQQAIDKLQELHLVNSKLNLPRKECEVRIEKWKYQSNP
jgi:hypothetical protein